MYLYFSYLGSWIVLDYKVHFVSSTITEKASNQDIVEKTGYPHSNYKAESVDAISKTTHIKQGDMALPQTSQTLQEYKHYLTVQTYSHNTTEKAFSLLTSFFKLGRIMVQQQSHLLNT